MRAGIDQDPVHGAVVPPLHLSSNFSFAGLGEKRRYDYTRSGNPTRDALLGALCDLEGAAGGLVTPSGMGAISVLLSTLPVGAEVVAPADGYGGTWRLLHAWYRQGRLRLRLADTHDPDALATALGPDTALLLLETPSNPLLRVTDVAAAVAAARARSPRARVAADNTFLSPLLQRPLDLGCDYVLHSTTKYLNGHSDVVGGCVLAREDDAAAELSWWGNCLGVTGAPFDAWLTLRGLRTLALRMRQHEDGARAVAASLDGAPAVLAVHWPGLGTHPGHALARRQQRGFGGMLSFELEGGLAAVAAFVDGLRCFTLAESLGGVESLVAHPATMTHAAMDPEARAAAGIGDGLLRLSVGLEDPADLVADLAAGLARARSG
ncbi:MAG: cystathionine gamma-synthase [Planctomycetota bacterium]